jgi:glucosylceramidase
MKDTKNMLQGGKLLRSSIKLGLTIILNLLRVTKGRNSIWGLTVQNEPMAKQTWESLYTARERDFVKNFLGPSLKRQD